MSLTKNASGFEAMKKLCDEASRSVLGEWIEYRDSLGHVDQVKALVNQAPVEITNLGSAPVSTQHFTLDLHRSDLRKTPQTQDQILLRGTLYEVMDVQNLGLDHVSLVLTRLL